MSIMDIDELSRQDYVSGSDVVARIEDLKDDRDLWVLDKMLGDEDAPIELVTYWEGRWADEFPDEAAELKELQEFHEEATGYSGDGDDYTAIADSYFEEYAQQLAEDIGAIKSDAGWPLMHIDWEAAANALKVDYTEVTLRSTEFQIR